MAVFVPERVRLFMVKWILGFFFYFKRSQFLPIRILNFDKYNKTTDVYIKNLTLRILQ